MRIPISLLVLFALTPVSAFAWGQEGHSIAAEIAERRLNTSAAAMVSSLLGPGVSLGSVSTWADDVREERPKTYNWHFVPMAMGQSDYIPQRDCALDPEKGDCAVAEILRAQKEMHCASDILARAEALKFLVHFVGDLHQPFHTVLEGFGLNRHAVTTRIGGETCGTACDFHRLKSEDENLHTVWDSTLIKKQVYGWGSYVDRLETTWLKTADVATELAGARRQSR
ncbi:S1/P1 nuclease [Ensifer sp. Root127]|uniref:S1/P1 nuclease n=1 Tax=Ensifer sp. Root127 TaxID=1736440 RepID=UPI0007093C5A|nr:S1/P1 nuclease [Ensifer sp. Root127]